MSKNVKKALTLIELLAVIVILAIIAVITVPVVLSAIRTARESSIKISASNYVEAIENFVASTHQDDNLSNDIDLNGTITSTAGIEVSGVNATSVNVTLKNGIVYSGYVTIDGNKIMIENGKIVDTADPTLEVTYKVYGVSFNGKVGTRLNDAIGFTYSNTTTNNLITSDFDNAEIYSEITEVTDSYGNVFVKIPKFYISKSVDASGNFTYKISKAKQDESYYLPYSFYDEVTGEVLPYVLIGKYDASLSADNKLESKTGVASLVNQTISQFRTYANNNNTGGLNGYQLIDIHAVDLIQTLFYVEFATLDSQSIMQGFTAATNTAKLNNGQTDSVTTVSGSSISNSDGKYAMKYRGIENFYGNIWQFIDGINIKENVAYINTKPSTYASDVFTGNYKQVGYTNTASNGYIAKMGYDVNNPFVQLPTVVGDWTSIYQDYYYQYPIGEKIAIFGGSWSGGSRAGTSCWNLQSDSIYVSSNLGSRLIKKAI